MTPQTRRELTNLASALARLAVSIALALADGIVTPDDLIRVGVTVPDLAATISDIATPDGAGVARKKLADGKRLLRERRRKKR